MLSDTISISPDGKFTVKAHVGQYLIPVDCTLIGDRIHLQFAFNKKLIAEVKNLDGASFDFDTKTWSCKANLRNFFSLDCLTTKKPLLRRFFQPPKEVFPDIEMWTHQVEMYQNILTYNFVILAAEMRTGKTLPTLKAIEGIPSVQTTDDIWWIAPRSAINGLYRELDKWNFSKEMKLMTYDKFRTLVNSDLCNSVPRFIVFDEAHKLKNPTSQTSKAAARIRDLQFALYEYDCFRVLLSGTPSPKNPTDWWNLAEIAMPGFIKEPSKKKLEKTLAEMDLDETTAAYSFYVFKHWKEDEVNRLYKRLRGLTHVYFKKDCLDLPEVMYEDVNIAPTPELMAVAKSVTDNAESVLEARNILRQLSDGFRYIKEYNAEKNKMERVDTEYFGSPKEDQLKTDLELYEDVGRVVVYGGFQATVDNITTICNAMGWVVLRIDGRGYKVFKPYGLELDIDKDLCLNEIDGSTNQGIIPKLAIVAQADAASTGLEFSASPVSIYYSNTDNGAARMQSEARPHSGNMNKNRGYLVKDYIHLPSDKKIRDSLKNKKRLQDISMGEWKEVFENFGEDSLEKLINSNRKEVDSE